MIDCFLELHMVPSVPTWCKMWNPWHLLVALGTVWTRASASVDEMRPGSLDCPGYLGSPPRPAWAAGSLPV
eukprot:gene7721-biopygen7574